MPRKLTSSRRSTGRRSGFGAGEARLWAPWRSAFVRRGPGGRCIFCAAKRGGRRDRAHHVIARTRQVFALLNRYPYTNGHLMVAPSRHVGTLEALTRSEWLDLWRLTRTLLRRLRRHLHPHGFNIGLNLGRVAGAGIPGHVHLHVVPRWRGDTNFMPVLGGTKVISQSLEEVYGLLAESPP